MLCFCYVFSHSCNTEEVFLPCINKVLSYLILSYLQKHFISICYFQRCSGKGQPDKQTDITDNLTTLYTFCQGIKELKSKTG